LVIAYHLVWTAYGWWLPNDPRGSGSSRIASDPLAALGDRHQGRKRIQPASVVVRDFYRRAEPLLKYDLLGFSSSQRDRVAVAFDQIIRERRYTCYACAVMPDHVHLLIRKHRDSAEQMIRLLQNRSRCELRRTGARDMNHPVWGGPGWIVFMEHPEDVRRTIRYIENNPAGMGLPPQQWSYVQRYDGWPLHPGHCPDSPYARRLRAEGRNP
jgi:REP element-mobilizing transposase RayT